MKYFKEYVFLMYLSSRFICRITTYWEIKFDFFGLQLESNIVKAQLTRGLFLAVQDSSIGDLVSH